VILLPPRDLGLVNWLSKSDWLTENFGLVRAKEGRVFEKSLYEYILPRLNLHGIQWALIFSASKIAFRQNRVS
jgi:hypothetical protein